MLLKHRGAENSTAGGELGPIITASRLFVVDELLEDAGIIEVNGLERPEDDTGYEPSSSDDGEDPASDTQTPPSGQRMGTISLDMISQLTTSYDPFLMPATSAFSRLLSSPERPELYNSC